MPYFGLVNLAQPVKEPFIEHISILSSNNKTMYPTETHLFLLANFDPEQREE